MKGRHVPVVFLLLIASLLLNGYFLVRRFDFSPSEETVTSVIDGDTIIVSNGERIRLLGVNAPEEGLCLSAESKLALEQLVLHKPVVIREEKKDSFNRRMGLVYQESILINIEMIRLGMGKPDYTKNTRSTEFLTAYHEAKEHQRGVNSPTCKKDATSLPPDPSCVIKGNIDQAIAKKFYHLPHCRHYTQIVLDLDMGERYFCTEKEARDAGFIRASGC